MNNTLSSSHTIPAKTPLIALVGNPNVGKSSVFNLLTGLRQHTGNWSGKTVHNTVGTCKIRNQSYLIADLPGTYSLTPESNEEKAARDFIAFERPDRIVYVCGALSLERNLFMCRELGMFGRPMIVCVNMTDEAEKQGKKIDFDALSFRLGLPVVPVCAKKNKGIELLRNAIYDSLEHGGTPPPIPRFSKEQEKLIADFEKELPSDCKRFPTRVLAVKSLAGDQDFLHEFSLCEPFILPNDGELYEKAKAFLHENGTDARAFSEALSEHGVAECRAITAFCVSTGKKQADRADRILTGKYTSYPFMLLLLALVFWITIRAANYPSELLSHLFGVAEEFFLSSLADLGVPPLWISLSVGGVWRVVAWIVAVMLPPMAIFFPLFTLLEDSGYLPRIAFNLDRAFAACGTCGKQALTMCMGYGCNAVGVCGCQIIGSERERLIAILTNSFSPCNGRFPMMIALIAMFSGVTNSFLQSAILCAMIVFSIVCTLGVSKLLSVSLLRGKPSSFVLELPPYRMPRIGSVLVHSLKDRTLSVLFRAVTVAVPCSILLWIAAQIPTAHGTLLTTVSHFLDTTARIFGLDGAILLAFVLGIPANEIVIPILMMIYLSESELAAYENLDALKAVFTANGWTIKTAVCTCAFALLHWPCATTLLTIKKQTASVRWTLLAFLIPTVCGLLTCFVLNTLLTFCGL